MGYSLYTDERWAGYGVLATCDLAGCEAPIDRGLARKCETASEDGLEPCGLFFCSEHADRHDCAKATPSSRLLGLDASTEELCIQARILLAPVSIDPGTDEARLLARLNGEREGAASDGLIDALTLEDSNEPRCLAAAIIRQLESVGSTILDRWATVAPEWSIIAAFIDHLSTKGITLADESGQPVKALAEFMYMHDIDSAQLELERRKLATELVKAPK